MFSWHGLVALYLLYLPYVNSTRVTNASGLLVRHIDIFHCMDVEYDAGVQSSGTMLRSNSEKLGHLDTKVELKTHRHRQRGRLLSLSWPLSFLILYLL